MSTMTDITTNGTDDSPDHLPEMPPEIPDVFGPALMGTEGPMDKYKRLLWLRHRELLSAKHCDRYRPTAHDHGDHVTVWCDGCGAVLHRKYRDEDEHPGGDTGDEGGDE